MQDLENTVGAWDLYGVDDAKRYPDIQNEFFERATSGLNNRGAMLRFLAVGAPPALLLLLHSLSQVCYFGIVLVWHTIFRFKLPLRFQSSCPVRAHARHPCLLWSLIA